MKRTERVRFASCEFSIDHDDTKPIYLALGIRKSGSSVMNTMVTALAKMNGINYVDIPGALFAGGVSVPTWQNDQALPTLIRRGNVYGGFRNAPIVLAGVPDVQDALKILLVRDPRDALVSEYFSNAYSHSLPDSGVTRDQMVKEREEARQSAIEDYVGRMSKAFRNTIREYKPFLAQKNLRLYKYEQAIMDKRWFLRDICKHFGWSVTDHQLELIMGWADVMPKKEVATEFVRKVVPGDHRDKLRPAMIERLNREMKAELAMIGYA